ncbi:MAG: hypothetical protein ABIG93_05565 [archaeon]|nr:hypothetical protein [Nanoarchaeota archaeon]
MLEKISNFIIRQKEIVLIVAVVLLLGVVFIPTISGVSLTGNLVAGASSTDDGNSNELLSILLFVLAITLIFIFSNKIKDFTANSIVSLNQKVRKGFEPDSEMSKKIEQEQRDLENKFSTVKKRK